LSKNTNNIAKIIGILICCCMVFIGTISFLITHNFENIPPTIFFSIILCVLIYKTIKANIISEIQYSFTKREFLQMKQKLTINWSKKYNKQVVPSDNDVYWALCNDKLLQYPYNSTEYYRIKEIQNNILRNEGRTSQNNTSTSQNDFAVDIDKEFSQDYLGIILEDGMTIKEHMDEDFGWNLYLSSKQSKIDFPKNVDEQYKHILYTLESYNDKYPSPTSEEEVLLKTFLQKVSLVRKNFHVYAKRWCDGTLCIYYNNQKIGTVNLRSKNYAIDIYVGKTKLQKSFRNISFNECLKNIDAWIRYCKYYVKN